MTFQADFVPDYRAVDADCHYGDHLWKDNGYCSNCWTFNGGWLAWKAFEKAEREGRACDDHFHRTIGAKNACKTPVKHPAPEDEA